MYPSQQLAYLETGTEYQMCNLQ